MGLGGCCNTLRHDHRRNGRCGIVFPARRDISARSEACRDLTQRYWPVIGIGTAQSSRQLDQGFAAVAFRIALTATALPRCRTLAVPSRFQFGDCGGLVELSDCTKHLTHQNGSGAVAGISVTPSFRRWS